MATGHTKDAVQRIQKSDSGKRTEIPPYKNELPEEPRPRRLASSHKASTCYVADGTRTILIHLHKVYLIQEAVEDSERSFDWDLEIDRCLMEGNELAFLRPISLSCPSTS
ncbi:hypothetical protein L798_14498 [Zootermopsis nevadensis]|uniref:Uncharacterized protein n=1 Tax=Zootermopsis nevadensis TaxID=136037 RepID=A0A067RUT8_ZOONE|nr:hypothetical protein L798_14498 [Zootermopsis nevadensis]